MKRIIPLALLFAVAPFTAVRAQSFHEQGSSDCATCHIMHASIDGQIVMVDSEPLLLAATASDLCLSCHGENGVFGLSPLAPPPERGGGNFVFLLEDNINDAPDGNIVVIAGEAAGHNITSLDMGTVADTRWSEAPGGTFPSHQLTCTSCHDPHGNANFRMLNGIGPIQGGQFVFDNPAPLAEGLDVSADQDVEANDNHTAYLAGMSAWCANCHGVYHDTGSGAPFVHPVDENLGNAQIQVYNRYDGIQSPMGGSAATAYLKDVPFESAGAAVTSTSGPEAGARIMCLTCHRAHATSAPAATRWDNRAPYLDSDGLVSGSYPIPNPYPAGNQPPLCRKCHPKGTRFDYDYTQD